MGQTIERAYVPDVMEVEGRTLVLRVCPYAVPAAVRDVVDGKPGPVYREAFAAGAFAEAIANRVHERTRVGLNVTHVDDPWRDVGRAVELTEDATGLVGTFAVDESAFGDHTLAKVRTGQWRGVSVKAVVLASKRDDDGVTWRTRMHPVHAALTETPAYRGAEVLALREAYGTPRLETWAAKYGVRVAP